MVKTLYFYPLSIYDQFIMRKWKIYVFFDSYPILSVFIWNTVITKKFALIFKNIIVKGICVGEGDRSTIPKLIGFFRGRNIGRSYLRRRVICQRSCIHWCLRDEGTKKNQDRWLRTLQKKLFNSKITDSVLPHRCYILWLV